jgi:hypothetical protein
MAENSPINDSADNTAVSFSELIRERAFLGEVPSEPIFDGIRRQFEDYINLEDQTNYVDVFYTQLALSYDRVNSDDSEEYPNEIREALDKLHQQFVDLMQEQLQMRLTLGLFDLESGVVHREDLEFILRRLYEFFILGAKHNFKTVIAADVLRNIGEVTEDDFIPQIGELMEAYNPLIGSIDPMEFLQLRGDEEIFELFDNGRVNGNFLRKYTPKLYQNDEFTVEIINHITMLYRFKEEETVDTETPPIIDEPELEDTPLEPEISEEEDGIDLDGIDVSKDIETAYGQEEGQDGPE